MGIAQSCARGLAQTPIIINSIDPSIEDLPADLLAQFTAMCVQSYSEALGADYAGRQ